MLLDEIRVCGLHRSQDPLLIDNTDYADTDVMGDAFHPGKQIPRYKEIKCFAAQVESINISK